MLEILNADEASKPAVVGFDIIFSGNVDEAGDEAFVNAAKKSGNVVVASQLIYKEKPEVDAALLRHPLWCMVSSDNKMPGL